MFFFLSLILFSVPRAYFFLRRNTRRDKLSETPPARQGFSTRFSLDKPDCLGTTSNVQRLFNKQTNKGKKNLPQNSNPSSSNNKVFSAPRRIYETLAICRGGSAVFRAALQQFRPLLSLSSLNHQHRKGFQEKCKSENGN